MQKLPNELKEFLHKNLRQLQGESMINKSLFNELKEKNLFSDIANSTADDICKRIEFVLDFSHSQGQLCAFEEILNFIEEKFGE